MTNQNNEAVKYDPNIHAGLLNLAGKDIIIANAEEAKMHELPLKIRKALADSTRTNLDLLDFASGIGGVVISVTDPELAATRIEGFKRGLKLLQLPED